MEVVYLMVVLEAATCLVRLLTVTLIISLFQGAGGAFAPLDSVCPPPLRILSTSFHC